MNNKPKFQYVCCECFKLVSGRDYSFESDRRHHCDMCGSPHRSGFYIGERIENGGMDRTFVMGARCFCPHCCKSVAFRRGTVAPHWCEAPVVRS